DYKPGEKVEAVFEDDGNWYLADVVKKNDDGSFTVKWDDPDGGPEESQVQPKEMKYPPIPVADLVVGDKYTGTIKTVLDFGAFVDIGAEGDGLLHIS
ncbi:pnp, partial [Symbiodinium pilosum]